MEISQLLDKRGEYSFVDLYSNFVGQTAIFTIILSQVIRYECFFMSSSKKNLSCGIGCIMAGVIQFDRF